MAMASLGLVSSIEEPIPAVVCTVTSLLNVTAHSDGFAVVVHAVALERPDGRPPSPPATGCRRRSPCATPGCRARGCRGRAPAFVPRTLRIVPLFSVSAPAATERPSVSLSAAATTRRKICVVGLAPVRFHAACALAVPRVSAKLGVPETPTAWSKRTSTLNGLTPRVGAAARGRRDHPDPAHRRRASGGAIHLVRRLGRAGHGFPATGSRCSRRRPGSARRSR